MANLTSTYTAANDSWTCSSPLPTPGGSLANGSYEFVARGFDKAGNDNQSISNVTVDYYPTYTWTGATLADPDPSKRSPYWGTPGNWSPYGVPDFGDIAVIDNGDTVYSTVSRNVRDIRILAGALAFTNGAGSLGILNTSGNSIWKSGEFAGIRNNLVGATLTIDTTSNPFLNNGTLNNAGTATLSGTAGTLRGVNHGTINNIGTFQIAREGLVAGNDGYEPLFINNGEVTLPATLASVTIGWSYQQGPVGVLNVKVGGSEPSQFDHLTIGDGAVLAGTVRVTKINVYSPAQDTTFAFLSATSVVGTFASVTGGFTAEYTAITATLRASAGLSHTDWATAAGLAGNDALASADPDGDGQTNFAEYAFNSNPKAGSSSPVMSCLITLSGQEWIVCSYRVWADREAAGVIYTPQSSALLTSWGQRGSC